MKIKETLIKIGAGIAAIATAIFYVLFKEHKENNLEERLAQQEAELKEERKKAEEAGVHIEAMQDAQQKENEERKENEKIKQEVHSGNSLAAHNALLDGLRK